MGRFGEAFEFSKGQLRVVATLAISALLLTIYLLVRLYGIPPAEATPLPIFMGDGDARFTGLFVLDPNTAPADSLELLPGIGKILADRIVLYRQTETFDHEVDITDVKGIGPKLFEKIRPYLRVRR